VHASLHGRARRFRDLLADARAAQEQVLSRVLARNRHCEYGRRHGFDRIGSTADFARRVPIVTYEELRADIERMSTGEPGVLVADPVLMFEETGGSAGGRKLIPYTAASLDAFRAGLLPWMDDLSVTRPDILAGSAYWSISPAARAARTTSGGIPIGMGSDAGYFGEELATQISRTLSVPPAVAGVLDIEQWRHVTTCYLLADEKLTFVSIWSPTFLLELLSYIDAHAQELASCVARGAFSSGMNSEVEQLPPLQSDPARAAYITASIENGGVNCSRLWQRLHLISCWDQGSSRLHAQKLKERFPQATLQGKGLLATEGLVSIPLTDSPWPVLAVESGYFEFLAADGRVCCAAQAQAGEQYELLITNDSGLYRYRIGDRVRVRDRVGTAPALEFLGRAGVSSDLVGEKLTDDFVIRVLAKLSLPSACLAAATQGYVLLADGAEVSPAQVDEIARACDLLLAENPQYAYARALGQLQPVRAIRCHRLMEQLTRRAMMKGQRLGDIKPPALIATSDWNEMLASAQ
jgi:GH3 auxin-responsive promoter